MTYEENSINMGSTPYCCTYIFNLSINCIENYIEILISVVIYSDAANAKENLSSLGFRVGYGHLKRSSIAQNRKPCENLDGSNWRSKQNFSEDNITLGVTTEQQQPHGICMYCRRIAFLNCGRCGDFYCSNDCQENDWLTHKRNCFLMPRLIQSSFPGSFHSQQRPTL